MVLVVGPGRGRLRPAHPGAAPQWPLAAGIAGRRRGADRRPARRQPRRASAGSAGRPRPLAAALVIAVVLHLLLALPDGRLGVGPGGTGAVVGYLGGAGHAAWCRLADRPACRRLVAAAGAGRRPSAVALPAVRGALPAAPTAVGPAAAAVGRLGRGRGRGGDRWSSSVLQLLVDWPRPPVAAAAAGVTVLVPLAPDRRRHRPGWRRMSTGCSCTCRVAGLAVVVAVVYLVVVLGLGTRPPTGDRATLLGLSMVAAAVAALLYLPARRRLDRAGQPARLRRAASRPTRRCAPSAAG